GQGLRQRGPLRQHRRRLRVRRARGSGGRRTREARRHAPARGVRRRLRMGRGARAVVTLAFLFPGQGSQAVGMGRSFYEASPAAKAVFEEANDALGFDLMKLAFHGPESDLALTANTQPARLTATAAAARAG